LDDDGDVQAHDDGEVAWDGGGDNHRLCCWKCNTTWSIPPWGNCPPGFQPVED
jgi:hypothetical protein